MIADVAQHFRDRLIPLLQSSADPPSQPEIPCGLLGPPLEPAVQNQIILSADWLGATAEL
ncbi:hypothetical protein SynROS8604_02870 [Synechococcus sp. ROS8604]|nr:hypothetical protein SynROS8604_02870 [Synechococcus sp. ROS8604]